MTDEQRPDSTEHSADEDAKSATPRWRLGGLSGRFRRRNNERVSPEPQEAAGDEDEMPFLPPMSVRPSFARPEVSGDESETSPTASVDRLDDALDDAEERDATPVTEPHPDLHPALRRDLADTSSTIEVDAPREGDEEASGDPGAAETSEAAPASGAETPATPATSRPEIAASSTVVEERIAITPRPVLPTPPPPPAMTPPSLTPDASADLEPPESSTEPAALPDSAPSESGVMTDDETADVPPTLVRRSTAISAYLAVLTGVATLVILAFLLIEPTPRWLLILGAGAVTLGLDGTLRQTWREPFALGQETAPFLFVPALYMLSVPVLIEHNITGEAIVLMGLGAGLGFGALARAELASVRAFGAEYPQARTIVAANTYLVGFAIFSLTYVFNISLVPAMIATGIAAGMLAVEILREGEIDPVETLGLSLVDGIVVAEARWLFYYMPLDTYLAGLALLLVFYLVTGLLHSYVVRALSRPVALQYGGITAAGLSLVVMARMTGLA